VADGTGNYHSSLLDKKYDRMFYVENFCDKGKVVCEYHADKWSAGQRYSFYQMLIDYQPPIEPEEDDLSLEDPADYTSVPMGLYDEENNPIGMTVSEMAEWRVWNNLPPNSSFTTPPVVQFEMMKMSKDCDGKCDSRRSEFRNKLVLAFSQNGYVIGGCKSTDSDNVVIEDDIDLLVDEIVERCKLQCPVTTYKIELAVCRQINLSEKIVSYTNSNVEIEYGVGGCAGDCPGNVANCQDIDCVNGVCPPNAVLSRCQQKKWKQVMDWDLEIDMPSKLSTGPVGSRKFTCVANPNMANYTEAPSSINKSGVPDINNFKAVKTVSPAVGIDLTLPGKN
jgi:hypothetical protein